MYDEVSNNIVCLILINVVNAVDRLTLWSKFDAIVFFKPQVYQDKAPRVGVEAGVFL